MIYITLGTSTKHSESQWLSFLPQSLTMFQVVWILETSQWIQTWSGWWNQQLSNRHGLLSWRRYSIERNNWDLRQVISNISDSGNNDHCLTFQDSTISTGNKKEGFHCRNHGRWNISFLNWETSPSINWVGKYEIQQYIYNYKALQGFLSFKHRWVGFDMHVYAPCSILWLPGHNGWVGRRSWCCLHPRGEVWHQGSHEGLQYYHQLWEWQFLLL